MSEIAAIWRAIAELREERVRVVEAEVTAVDPADSTFTVAIDGEVAGRPLVGVSTDSHHLPEVGSTAELELAGAQVRHRPGPIAENAITDRELDQDIVDSIDQAVTLSNGKNRVTFATTTPSLDGTTAGDIWWQRSGAVLVGAWEWDGDSWEPRTFGDQVLDSLTAGKIVTGTLDAATTINVGDPAGDHTAIDGTAGVVARVDDPVDGTPNDVARFGRTSGGTDPVTGEQTWSIDEAGNASFNDGTFNSLRVGGTEISASLDAYARGLAVWSDVGKIQSSIALEFGVLELYFVSRTNRDGHVTVDLHLASTEDSGEVVVRVRRTTDGSRPTVASPEIAQRVYDTPAVAGRWRHYQFNILLQSSTPQPTKLLLTVARGDAQTTGTVATVHTNPSMFVYDDGPLTFRTGTADNDGATGGTSTPPASRQVYLADATWAQNFKGDGSVRTDTTDLVQGYNSVNGDGRAMIGWPDLTSMLSGASIASIKVFLYAYHWHSMSGGTALIGTHNQTGAPGSFSGVSNRIQVSGWARSSGRWVDITGWAAEFQSGATRGITLGPSGGTNLQYYGRFLGVSDGAHPDLRPKLEIVYYK